MPQRTLIERAVQVLRFSSGQESAGPRDLGGTPPSEPSAVAVDACFEAAREQVRTRARSKTADDSRRQRLALQILEEGRRGLLEVARKRDAAQLSEAESAGLEAIVRLVGRPSLLVQDGKVTGSTPEWADALMAAAAGIERTLECVGRVNVPELGAPGYQGTAFLVEPELVMTNRHVALSFAELTSGTWRVPTTCRPAVDFRREHDRQEIKEHEVVAIELVHPDPLVDLALLRIKPQDRSGKSLPQPLPLAGDESMAAAQRTVYVVGYPAYDWRNDASAIEQIFGDVFNVKRFAPGELMGKRNGGTHIAHDCSTLGGNSGSCVIDFSTHRVLGLHFSGSYLEENRAASLPRLRQDTHVNSKGLNFA